MIRTIIFLALIGAVAFAIGWFIDRPGSVEILWLDHQISTSVSVLIAAIVLLAAAVMIAWRLFVTVVRSPGRIAGRVRARRLRKGHHAITRGLVAIGAGDVEAAARFAGEAKRLVASEPLTFLLRAQSAQLSGDRGGAEQVFKAMLARPELKLLGLHGLFIEARRRGDMPAARALADEAVRIAPAPQWAGSAVLEFRCASGDWSGALQALDANYQSGLVSRALYRRQRAVLLTARAQALLDGDREVAKAAAFEAVKLVPDLVPAAALAARLRSDAGDVRKATRIIEAAWRAHPHPDLAQVYVHVKPGDSATERLARAEKLAQITPGSVEGRLALAQAAIDAQAYAVARNALSPLTITPTQRVAVLMAQLEEKESGDVGRARAWMARAVRAARDPVWTADGYVSDVWKPMSPATGRLDAFEWKVPLAEIQGPVIDAEALTPAVVEALPAVQDAAPQPEPEPVAPEEAKSAADDGGSKEEPPSVTKPAEPVIPLMHAPDDPGPEPADDAGPIAEPRRESWRLFR